MWLNGCYQLLCSYHGAELLQVAQPDSKPSHRLSHKKSIWRSMKLSIFCTKTWESTSQWWGPIRTWGAATLGRMAVLVLALLNPPVGWRRTCSLQQTILATFPPNRRRWPQRLHQPVSIPTSTASNRPTARSPSPRQSAHQANRSPFMWLRRCTSANELEGSH